MRAAGRKGNPFSQGLLLQIATPFQAPVQVLEIVEFFAYEMPEVQGLPAGGTALCWTLLMTLGLPTLNYARSYAPLVRNVQARMDAPGCAETYGFTRAQVAAFRFHGRMQLQPAGPVAACPWLLVHSDAMPTLRGTVGMGQWTLVASIRRPADKDEDVLLFRR